MINPDAEIAKLRYYLDDRGWLPQEIEEVLDLASRDINETILDVISNAVAETTDYALDMGAEEFVEDITVVEIGTGFMITTQSGQTNYSTPERQMLHDLTKNGKVSEDGHRYKVIPVGGKRSLTRPTNIFGQMQEQQREQQDARASLLESNMDKRTAKAQHMAGHFRSIISSRLEAMQANKSKQSNSYGEPEFRTASTKQDPAESWVVPAKDMDMTGYLMDMNSRIEATISGAISFIIESYEKEFA